MKRSLWITWCRVFGPKTVYIVSITAVFFKTPPPKFISFPAKTQSGLKDFFLFFCFFSFLFIVYIIYLYRSWTRNSSCVEFLSFNGVKGITLVKSPWDSQVSGWTEPRGRQGDLWKPPFVWEFFEMYRTTPWKTNMTWGKTLKIHHFQ